MRYGYSGNEQALINLPKNIYIKHMGGEAGGGRASAQNLTQLLRIVCQASNDLETYAIIIYTLTEQCSL